MEKNVCLQNGIEKLSPTATSGKRVVQVESGVIKQIERNFLAQLG